MQRGRLGRLEPVVALARRAVRDAVLGAHTGTVPQDVTFGAPGRASRLSDTAPGPYVLVACSGGADSLALAAATAHFHRAGHLRAGAVVVDHRMQHGSARVAARTAETLRELGLDPVLVRTVSVERTAGHGPEKAARLARYRALVGAADDVGAGLVLLGHTRDDQAETVLLGLARGSGGRSLAGMPARTQVGGVEFVRPLLEFSRAQTEAVCHAEGLEPWHDPTNRDPALTRSRVRHVVLPVLERELGPGVGDALARTAAILRADSDYLDEQAEDVLRDARVDHGAEGPVLLDQSTVREAALPVRMRVLAAACRAAGGENPTHERLSALDGFATGHGAAGPLQMAGKVAVWRRRAGARYATDTLEFAATGGDGPR